jgi:hypothetical protein
MQFAPGVYVAFQGASGGTGEGYLNGSFSVYVVTKGVSDDSRRRGTPRVIGAYDLVNLLAPVLGGMAVEGVGTLHLTGIDNLFRDATFDLGGTVYAIQLALPNMGFDFQVDESTLSDFVLWHADHYNPDGIAAGEAPLATDEVHA